MKTTTRRESGATLLVTLIMLIMLTLFAISAMTTSTSNLQMVGNMQQRAEALEAAQATIELAISSDLFTKNPGNALLNPCGVANTTCTDLNGDGINDLITTLNPNPQCVQARKVPVSELVVTGPLSEDFACTQMQSQGTFAVAGASASADSLCGQTVWDVTAVTLRPGMAANNSDIFYGVTQGVAVRIPALQVDTACP